MSTENVIYTARTHTIGRRDGASCSPDSRLDIWLSMPSSTTVGTNPEQLFAAGWSVCFEGAIGRAARKTKVALPIAAAIGGEVNLCLADGAYFLQAHQNGSLPGLSREVAQATADTAHQICPQSKAIRSNIDVVVNVV